MANFLDMAGSFIIGGIVVLSITALTFYFSSKSQDNKLSEISQRTTTELGSILEHDMNRLGYRVAAGSKIVSISDSSLKFLADLDNNGTVDTVHYSQVRVSGVKLFKRRVAAQTSNEWTNPVDSMLIRGLTLRGSATVNTDSINSISISLVLKEETQNDNYTGSAWQRQFFPKNL